jgi:hypothetical protein
MSIPFGKLLKEVEDVVKLHGADDLDSMKRSINLAYFQLCGMRSWLPLRRKVSVDFTSHDSNNAMLLPGDLAGIDEVWDSEREYFPSEWGRSEKDDSASDCTYRWFYTEPVSDALAILSSVTVLDNANTFSGGSWLAAYIGEYMQIGAEQGAYKLTAERTFTPRWYGPRIAGTAMDYIQIRPPGTKRFSIVNDDGDFEENTVSVYYWAFPVSLYKDFQPVLLPDVEALKWLSIITTLGLKDRKDNLALKFYGFYETALRRMESMSPDFVAPSQTKDRYGEGLKWKN